jgi:LCP family protein required for cell wall assembly
MRVLPRHKFATSEVSDVFALALANIPSANDPILSQEVVPVLWARKRRRWPLRLAWTVLTLLLIALAFAGYAYYKGEQLVLQFQAGGKFPLVQAALPQLNITPPKESPILKKALLGSETFLLIGSDTRFGSGGYGNSDTILLANVNSTTNTVSLLSLPRDLYVNIPGHGMAKINAAYALGGPALTIATIRDFIGVKINHFVDVGFYGFDSVVNSLGGVYLPIDGRYYHVSEPDPADDWSSIDLQPGYQLLDGSDALEWVRFRHEDSDFYRVARQQIFLREVARQVRAQITDPTRIISILHALADATASDIHSFSYLLSLANTLRGIPSSHIVRTTLQAQGLVLDGSDILEASPAQKAAAIHAWADPDAAIALQTEPSGHSPTTSKAASKTLKTSPIASPPETAPAPSATSYAGLLVSDAGSGKTLLAPYHNLQRCAPTELPLGYTWGALSPAREYSLAGHPAVAAWATAGSGESVLWMWTTWQDPPILSDPSQTVVRDGRNYQLYYDSGRLRMVAWRIGSTRAWVTNTLLNALSDSQMIALANTCQPL